MGKGKENGDNGDNDNDNNDEEKNAVIVSMHFYNVINLSVCLDIVLE